MANLQQLELDYTPEIWKDIEGYEGLYQVSNLGRVKSLGRFIRTRRHANKWQGEIILKPGVYENGYRYYALFCAEGPKKHKRHRLMASAFIPNPDNLPFVNHKNGIKGDDRLDNFEWCTPKENAMHASKSGLLKGFPGSKNPSSVLTEEIVNFIVTTKGQFTAIELGKRFGVGRHAIESVFRGDTWSHITGIPKRIRDVDRRILENKQMYNFITKKKAG